MIKVKQLEWEGEDEIAFPFIYSKYISEYLRYKIECDDGCFCCYLHEPIDQFWDEMCDTLEEAKAACQKHYEALILSGLETNNED